MHRKQFLFVAIPVAILALVFSFLCAITLVLNSPARVIVESLSDLGIDTPIEDMGLIKVSPDRYLLQNPPTDPTTHTVLSSWQIKKRGHDLASWNYAHSIDLEAIPPKVEVCIYLETETFENLTELAERENQTVEEFVSTWITNQCQLPSSETE